MARLSWTIEGLVQLMRRAVQSDRFSPSMVSTLTTLDHAGPTRVTELAGALGVTQPAMTQIVDRLDRHGLVRRTPSPRDRRAVLVELTDAGRASIAERRAARVAVLTARFDGLPPEDRQAVIAALPALGRLGRPEGL